jgi:tetratricopeptide (TPR) repeat protein
LKAESFFDVIALDSTSESIDAQADIAGCWQEYIHPYGVDSWESILDAYDGTHRIDPDDALAWLDKGEMLDLLGRDDHAYECFSMAVKICDEALEIDPEDAGAWWYKAEALQSLGMLKEAAEACDKILELHPDDLDAWLNKALVLQQLGMDSKAVEAFETATELISCVLDRNGSMNFRRLCSGDVKGCAQPSEINKGGM